MTDELRFEGRVAIVTGAGNGLGRAHALLLASRGARVVVNDLGGAMTGGGRSSQAADQVVQQIIDAGGEAVADYESVEEGRRIVEHALDAFGRVDIVVNNAGILRDTSFHKMSEEDWDLIYRVHVLGSFRVTHAAWSHMRDQKYGRVVMTASAAGIYGNFGQANYSMAKLGLLGLSNTLAQEGAGKGIQVNTIAPIAGSRLTETVLPKELIDALKPEYVSPLVAWLCHESCPESGGLFEVGGGYFGKLRWQRAAGQMFRLGRTMRPEDLEKAWAAVTDFEHATYPASVTESLTPILDNINAGPSRGGNDLIDVDAALAYRFPKRTTTYDERDLSLYALGVGAAANPMDDSELQLVYELHQDGFLPLPSYGVIPAVNNFLSLAKEGVLPDGFNFGLERILHGEQRMTLMRPLPTHAKLTHEMRVKDVFDKGKHAFVDIETKSYDESGELLMVNSLIAVIRGAGGFGGSRGETGERNTPPAREPDAVVEEAVHANQALLYRLSGDWNPLHADPGFAKAMGFDRPILHGLCTMGYAVRHVVKAMVPGGDPRLVHGLEVRMSKSVFPGDTLITEMWKEGDRILFQTRVKGRDDIALSQGAVSVWEKIPEPKAAPAPKASEPAAPKAQEVTSAAVFSAIGAYIKGHPELVEKIATIYQFQLTGPDSVWTLDLKAGAVAPGETGKPDCTLRLSDADFMGMVRGEKDPQQLFMKGELKISGNIMASQKLTFLQKVDPKEVAAAAASTAPAPAAAPTVTRSPVAKQVFEALAVRLSANPALGKDLQADLRIHVQEPGATATLRMKDGRVSLAFDDAGPVQTTVSLTDEDLERLAKGEETAKSLFMHGRLKVEGAMAPAHRLSFLSNLI
ncbi:MAG: SDR family NAD(P)-dependent oxidoreductase [Deltaproteobacteria bacterium]|nr:SDR family NAD(P)-dependent oxidoreductase [Deltaproteobacteria bacterium]